MSDERTTDWLMLGRSYLQNNAAESGADVIIAGLCDEIERLHAEGTRRMKWIIDLIEHAKALGTRYATDWHKLEDQPHAE